MIYTALGDSITFGQDASTVYNSYPSRIVTELRHHSSTKVSGATLAQPGWTSAELAGMVGTGVWRIQSSDVVSIWIGGNDLGLAAMHRAVDPRQIKQTLLRYQQNLHMIVGTIRKVSAARIVLCTQYNPFPNSRIAVQGVAALNGVTAQTAKAFKTGLAPVHTWFDGKQAALIAGYRKGRVEDALQGKKPIHPNDRGYALIATHLSPLISGR